ncbi:MAG: 4Fe-4S binding protein, partial [Syntrophaceae bacterium]|nr:4Fe-4S binding protein [Syntrophaceae bacterium]
MRFPGPCTFDPIPLTPFRRNIVRIIIKKEACIGCEICVNICPEVFMEWGL